MPVEAGPRSVGNQRKQRRLEIALPVYHQVVSGSSEPGDDTRYGPQRRRVRQGFAPLAMVGRDNALYRRVPVRDFLEAFIDCPVKLELRVGV